MHGSPFLIEGPALISFSGGRTSAYMLWRILEAHGGALPADVHVCFANTGKEREETLRFVHECSTRWAVKVHWLEWRDAVQVFEEVGYNSASRQGEPFAALIRRKSHLPNAVTRFCTQELKIRTMRDYARSLGWERWLNIIGLRHDEGHRVLKALARNDEGKERFTVAMPLAKARLTNRDVRAFWRDQPFDLDLLPYEGNCDLCFLKGKGKLQTIMQENPGIERWWADREREVGGRFVTEYGYDGIAQAVRDQGHLFDGFMPEASDEHDVECGLHCAE